MKANENKSKNGDGAVVWPDAIMRAIEREREAKSVSWPMEHDCSFEHVFTCVCCGKIRREEQRREPDSEVCLSCVQKAGFEEVES